MRKLINDPADVVEDLITGLTTRTDGLARVAGWPVVVRARRSPGTVALISGGGSGHEPAHAGFVGRGMLDAAVCGPVFTSPSVDAVVAAMQAVGTDRDVLLIVKNYTGDRLNFGLAAQTEQAAGRTVATVVVADDVALGDTAGAGRRGIGGTVLVHKVAGAAAGSGRSVQEVKELAERFLAGTGTMGIALGPCLVPGADAPNFELGEDEVEWGLGIHGEPGRERGSAASAREVAERLTGAVVHDRGLREGDAVVVLVDGLGATPPLELEVLTGEVLAATRAHGLDVRLCWTASMLTSLDMPGASVTLARADDEILDLLTTPTDAPGWVAPTVPVAVPQEVRVEVPDPLAHLRGSGPVAPPVLDALFRAADALLDAEPRLTDLDRRVGDGDLGTNLSRGARALVDRRAQLATAPDLRTWFLAVAQVLRHEVGGTSGPLYALLVTALGEAFEPGRPDPAADALARGFQDAVSRLQELGGAKLGDATMMDALIPAAEVLAGADIGDPGDLAARVLAAARSGAEATTGTAAGLGRSSYLGDRAVGVPDPGAVAVTVWLEAVLRPWS